MQCLADMAEHASKEGGIVPEADVYLHPDVVERNAMGVGAWSSMWGMIISLYCTLVIVQAHTTRKQ